MLAGSPRLGRAYTIVIFYIPATIGSILVETLPFKNKIGLLFSYWTSGGCKFFFAVSRPILRSPSHRATGNSFGMD